MDCWIMHIDMDAFFASVEQLDTPELRGKAVIVGGGARGVVCAASYEARAFGVHSAMPIWKAKSLCPHAVFTPVRMARYVEVSRHIMQILQQFSPTVEQASVDEAYLDATGLERLFGPVESLGKAVKAAVKKGTELNCSVGLAPVKFLAKIASDINKPDGLTILYPQDVPEFLRCLPVRKIPGVGKTFMKSLDSIGVHSCGDVCRYPVEFWERRFGKAGLVLFERAQGVDTRHLTTERVAKSESAEHTLAEDTMDVTILRQWLFRQADRVGRSVRRHGYKGRVVTLKVKYADFTQLTRRCTLDTPTCATRTVYETACTLLNELKLAGKVRLIGLGLSGFEAPPVRQLLLPLGGEEPKQVEAQRARLDATMDNLQQRFGSAAISHGALFSVKK